MLHLAKPRFISMNSKKKLLIYFFVLILLLSISMISDVFSNIWNLLTARGFIIPKESSILTFRTTLLNQGSGEWWIYGEDNNFFYYFTGEEKMPYIKITRTAASNCKNFDPLNYLTWCDNNL